jgi:hypothetical protein
MAKRQSSKKLKPRKQKRAKTLYTKVVRATRKEMQLAGLDLSYNSVRKFVSQNVYAEFKGKKINAVKVKDIREFAKIQIDQKLKQVPVKPPRYEYIDPRAISEVDVSDIDYWDMDDFLSGQGDRNIYQSRALQGANAGKNLRFEVIAGAGDRTGELNLIEYDGYSSGVKEMIERIRQEVQNESGVYFMGIVGRRSGMTDDSDPNSYILQFILYINDQPVVPPDETVTPIPIEPLTIEDVIEAQRKRREEATKRDEAEKRRADAELSRKRRGAKRPTGKKKQKEELIEPTPTPPPVEPKKPTTKTRGDRVLELNEQKLKELEMLRKDLDDKIINKREYKKERDRIMTQYEEALKKLKRGGII